MAHALGVTREQMLLAPLPATPPGFAALLARRLAHQPIAYILGSRAFWTIELAVGPGVLVPRPDSETLIEAAVAHFGEAGPRTILDLGTGSGALLLAALDQWPNARGIGVDRSTEAIATARGNADRLAMSHRTSFIRGDWAAAIDARFDLLLCNPPYVEDAADLPPEVRDHEPACALFAGIDGLKAYRALIPEIPRLLNPAGIAAIEIGATQAAAVAALAARAGLAADIRRDLAGRDRCIVLKR